MVDASSITTFASNVTELSNLAHFLLQVAQVELGESADRILIEQRATRLLVEAMTHVGIDPKSEQVKRTLIFAALRGEPLSDQSTLQVVDYILGQMVAKPKGALAERLARLPCAAKIAAFQHSGKLPPNVEYIASAWSKRLAPGGDNSTAPQYFEWRDGADGVIYCRAGSHAVRHIMTGATLTPNSPDVFILGVVEVKAYHKLKRGEPKRQLDKHLARLTRGLQTRDKDGNVTMHFEPAMLHFATWRNGCLEAIPVAESSFGVVFTSASKSDWQVTWSTPLPLLQLAVGPTPASPKKRKSRFDAYLPYSESDLEQFGNDVMHYTLGAMGDDEKEVDLPGSEWAWNLEMLFDSVDVRLLKVHQVSRLKKLLRWLRGDSS